MLLMEDLPLGSLHMRPTLIFVDTIEEAREAIDLMESKVEENYVILATTPSAQNVLAHNGIDFTLYGKLIPDTLNIQKIVDLANDFSLGWFKKNPMESALNFEGINLAYYLVGYWTNLLILFLLSQSVIKKAVEVYNPSKILYFPKDLPPEQAINTDYFILKTCCSKILRPGIMLESLKIDYKNSKAVLVTRNRKLSLSTLGHINDSPLIAKIVLVSYLKKFAIMNPEYKKADVLIYGDKHILPNAIPLIKTLQKHFSVQIVGALLSWEQKIKLIKAGLSFETFEDLAKPAQPSNTINNIDSNWKKFSKSSAYSKMLKKYGLVDLEPAISQKFESYFRLHLPNVFTTLSQTKLLINKVSPKATILFGNYGKKGLSLSYLTQKQGGKSFILEHGIVPNPIQVHPPIYDKMLFWGNWSLRGYYNAFHESKKKMDVVGWFLTENLTNQMKNERREAQKRSGFNISKLTVLLLTTFPAYDFPKQLKMILDVIKSLNLLGVQELIIRPHPGENLPYDLPLKQLKLNIKVSWDLGNELDKQLKSADIVISEGTSVALRAMMWGKPLLHLVTENIVDYTNFSRFGAAIKINHKDDIPKAIVRLSKSKIARLKMLRGQEKQLMDFCYKLDGKSAERVVQQIRKITEL